MNKSRLWIFGSVITVIVIVALGWFAGVAPRLAEARTADEDRARVAALNDTYRAKLAELQGLSKDLPALQAELAGLQASLPADVAVAELLGQLNAIADRTGTQIAEFTADVPSTFGPEVAAAPAPAASAAPPSDQAAASSAVATPSIGSSLFVAVPVSVTVTGDPAGYPAFFEGVQFGTRLFLVTDIEITNGTEGSRATASGLVFVMRSAAAAPTSPTTAPTEQEAQAQG